MAAVASPLNELDVMLQDLSKGHYAASSANDYSVYSDFGSFTWVLDYGKILIQKRPHLHLRSQVHLLHHQKLSQFGIIAQLLWKLIKQVKN